MWTCVFRINTLYRNPTKLKFAPPPPPEEADWLVTENVITFTSIPFNPNLNQSNPRHDSRIITFRSSSALVARRLTTTLFTFRINWIFVLCFLSLPTGVWSPHNRSTEVLTKAELAERSKTGSNGEPVQPVWTPRSAPPSPVSERREFRPIGFESPTPTRRTVQPPSSRAETPQVPAPWTTSSAYDRSAEFSSTPPTAVRPSAEGPPPPSAEGLRRHPHQLQTSNSLPTIGPRDGSVTPSHTVRFAPHSKPAAAAPASPTINTILKNKGKFRGLFGHDLTFFSISVCVNAKFEAKCPT